MSKTVELASKRNPEDRYTLILLENWFTQAEQAGDFVRAKVVFGLMDQGSQQRLKERLQRVEQDSQHGFEEVKKQCQEARQSVQVTLKDLEGRPTKGLPEPEKATILLQKAIDAGQTWLQKTGEADCKERQVELKAMLDHLEGQKKAIEGARQQLRGSRINVIERLWPLVLPGSPHGQPRAVPEGTPAGAVSLPEARRHRLLVEMLAACDELLHAFPTDPDAIIWRDWRAEIQKTTAGLGLAAAGIRPEWPSSTIRRLALAGVCAVLVLFIGTVIWTQTDAPAWFANIQTTVATRISSLIAMPTESPTTVPLTLTPVPSTPTTPTPTSKPPTPTPLTLTPTPVPLTPTPITPVLAPLPVTITFPRQGAIYPVFPWQVLITSTIPTTFSMLLEPVTVFTQPVTVTLSGRQVGFTQTLPLTTSQVMTQDGLEYVYRWVRSVSDLRELGDREYRLQIDVANDDRNRTKVEEVSFKIDGNKAITTSVSSTDGILVRLLPTADSSTSGHTLLAGAQVRVLGQLRYIDEQKEIPTLNKFGLLEQWCYFETQDGRRAWTWCALLSLGDGIKNVPAIAPAIPTRLYTSGGK